MNNLKFEKNKRQPSKIKTGGSTFKNPIGKSNIKVWELIKNSVSTKKNLEMQRYLRSTTIFL